MNPISLVQVRDYYSSIQGPFEETNRIESKESKVGFFKATLIFGLIFSLVPLIPWGLSVVFTKLVRPRLLAIWTMRIPTNSFWFLWPVAFALFLIALILAFRLSRPSEEQRKRRLSPAHMRFAYCFSAFEEITDYQTNKLKPHLEKAQEYLAMLSKSFLRLLLAHDVVPGSPPGNVIISEDEPIITGVYGFAPVTALSRRLRWFKLEPQTEKIVSAISGIDSKMEDRIKDKKDLSNIASILTDLATYLYTEIPEICDGTDEDKKQFQEYGDTALNAFADKLNALQPYKSEAEPLTPHQAVSRKFASTSSKVSAFFTHENVLVCFCAWYIFSAILICFGFWLASLLIPAFKLDTVILSTIVGGPVAGAITAVTVARLGRRGPTSPTSAG